MCAAGPTNPEKGSRLSTICTLFFTLPVAFIIFLLIQGPGLEQKFLPPETALVTQQLITKARVHIRDFFNSFIGFESCELGDICSPTAQRPPLPDGTPSHSVWDLPRRLMKDRFSDVTRIIPNAKVNYMWDEPLVVYYDQVLTEDEINHLIDSANPRFEKSMVVGADGVPKEGQTRTSETAWLFINEDPTFEKIVSKVTALAGFSSHHSEHIGVNRYQPSQFFNPHHDFLQEEQLNYGEFTGCQRASTALIYLSDVEEGGDTMFTRISDLDGRFQYSPDNPDHLKVKPKRGRVLIWYNMHPYTEKVDHRTLHGGSPVVRGTKVAATLFIRNCSRLDIPSSDVHSKAEESNKGDSTQSEILDASSAEETRNVACQLGDICPADAVRPTLSDGSISHSVWDLPRKLMNERFKSVSETIPTASVNYMWDEPLVLYYDNVLTEEDIDLMINSATPRLTKSMVVGPDGKGAEDNTRTSDTAWLYMSEDPKIERIVQKVTTLAGFTPQHAEHIGVNRYKPSQYFNPHHDFIQEHQLEGGEFPGCQRSSTALIYLSDVEEGGETMFTRASDMDGRFQYDANNPHHLRVKPKRGRVLVWYNMHPFTEKVDPRTLHGGSPVVSGIKMAATIFIRNCTRPTPTQSDGDIRSESAQDAQQNSSNEDKEAFAEKSTGMGTEHDESGEEDSRYEAEVCVAENGRCDEGNDSGTQGEEEGETHGQDIADGNIGEWGRENENLSEIKLTEGDTEGGAANTETAV